MVWTQHKTKEHTSISPLIVVGMRFVWSRNVIPVSFVSVLPTTARSQEDSRSFVKFRFSLSVTLYPRQDLKRFFPVLVMERTRVE